MVRREIHQLGSDIVHKVKVDVLTKCRYTGLSYIKHYRVVNVFHVLDQVLCYR